MTTADLEHRAIHLIGPEERRLFLMDDAGTYWVRSDMTSAEAENAVDYLASWLHHACKGEPLGANVAARLYDDGERSPR